ncbi:MAG: tetratricopeptide repeat protein [Bryobacteraceae bacterium]
MIALLWLARSTVSPIAERAQSDFDRVTSSVAPNLSDALTCVQSQASALAVALPADAPLLHYRKAYCTVLEGVLSRDGAESQKAAAEIGTATELLRQQGSSTPPEWRALAAIAQLEAGGGADTASLDGLACNSGSSADCTHIMRAGQLWRAWILTNQNRLSEAATLFDHTAAPAWISWVHGLQAMGQHSFNAAAVAFDGAVKIWTRTDGQPLSGETLIGPKPDLGDTLLKLGEAQYLAGEPAAAIASFNASLQRQPRNAWTVFLRGRARYALSGSQASATDYVLASRMALAAVDGSFASGDSHFYRGVSIFESGDYERAEEEFASALSYGLQDWLRADATAWWRLAAVAGGSCQASKGLLEASLLSVSEFFPKKTAEEFARACRQRSGSAKSATVLQYGIREQSDPDRQSRP